MSDADPTIAWLEDVLDERARCELFTEHAVAELERSLEEVTTSTGTRLLVCRLTVDQVRGLVRLGRVALCLELPHLRPAAEGV